MHPFINTAFKAARKAGQLITRSMDRLDLLKVDEKSLHNYVTNIDKEAELIILDILKKAYPEHGYIAEESGNDNENASHVWIIDPLDGTMNFIRGFPHFAISMGLKIEDKIEHGLIYDPVRDELFTASRGEGTRLNNKRIRVTSQHSLSKSFIATGAPKRDKKQIEAHFEILKSIYIETSGIRRAGSAALDLAYVAAGRFDGFFELGLQPWDIAAGSILVKEAGGLVGTFSGDHNYLETGQIIAATPKIFKILVQTIHHLTE